MLISTEWTLAFLSQAWILGGESCRAVLLVLANQAAAFDQHRAKYLKNINIKTFRHFPVYIGVYRASWLMGIWPLASSSLLTLTSTDWTSINAEPLRNGIE